MIPQRIDSSPNPLLLELEDVTVVRGHHRILDHVTLSIPTNVHTVILGPNGSGKSSLLKVLMRQFYPSIDDGQSGIVRIFGQSTWNIAELRTRLGIVSGELDNEFASPRSGRMSGLQAVLSGLDGVRLVSHISSIGKDSIHAAREALARIDASELEQQSIATMSTGERRRVLIARALIHRPKAIVLDEPTTGLDIGARNYFLDQLEVLANSGTTIVLVTHHVEEIISQISNVILLKRGRVHATGTREELLRNETLSDLFDFPIQIQADKQRGRFVAI